MKRILIIMLLMVLPLASLMAQESNEKGLKNVESSWYLQAKGGLLKPTQHDGLESPIYGFDLGYHFNPVIGTRLNINHSPKVKLNSELKAVTTNIDLLLNVANMFSKQKTFRPWGVYLLGGVGLNYTWDIPYEDELLDHNFRVGAMADYRPFKHLSLSLEVDFDNHSGKLFQYIDRSSKKHWSMNVTAGVAWHFGFKYAEAPKANHQLEVTTLSLYEQMQAKVADRMTNWMKRAKGESKADYQLRTSADSIASMRLKFEEEVSTEMADDLINRSGAKFGRYSRKNSLATVEFDDLPSIVIGMSKEKMMATKTAGKLVFRNTKYRITPDSEYEIVYTEIETDGSEYAYDNTDGNAPKTVGGADYIPLGVMQQTIQNEVRLEHIKDYALKQARNENLLNDNVTINVAAEVIPADNNHYDYKITYRYDVKDEFSVHKDFAPGKYNAEQSKASVTMMNIIKEAFSTDFAQYIKPGKRCDISLTGTADAMPIHNRVIYHGEYGDVVTEDVYVNGKNTSLSVSKKNGIRSNEELSMVRAVSVKDFIDKYIPNLKDMKVKHDYNLEVSQEEGSQHRRVKVVFYFYDAF